MNSTGTEMSELFFDGEIYNDDRIFVLFIAKCTTRETDEFIATTIHYETTPNDAGWCVATFRNVERYRAYRIDSFDTKAEAEEYLAEVEPITPLISLGGKSPAHPMPLEKYSKWKSDNNFKEYDHKTMFPTDVKKPEETITRWKK